MLPEPSEFYNPNIQLPMEVDKYCQLSFLDVFVTFPGLFPLQPLSLPAPRARARVPWARPHLAVTIKHWWNFNIKKGEESTTDG
jgi:hypothetical protein